MKPLLEIIERIRHTLKKHHNKTYLTVHRDNLRDVLTYLEEHHNLQHTLEKLNATT